MPPNKGEDIHGRILAMLSPVMDVKRSDLDNDDCIIYLLPILGGERQMYTWRRHLDFTLLFISSASGSRG